MVKKRGLGKSLDALLAYGSSETTATAAEHEQKNGENLSKLSVSLIQRGKYQPRREMDPAALEELAASIRSQGIIQPLIVRPVGNRFEIIAGERRFRAAQMAGLTEVPVIIRHIPDEAAIAIALIENIQRENLNPIEEAIALQRLIDEFGMTHQQAAEAVGKSRATVSNLLRLLALPEEVKALLETGKLEMGHARTLITLPAAAQLEAAEIMASRGLSVREAENLVRRLQSAEPAQSKATLDPDLLHLQETLSKQLKLKVAISCNAKGRGKLVVHYRSLAELNSLLLQIQND
jgi:ParB family transcriptional regulator, chromosome partitioning protein